MAEVSAAAILVWRLVGFDETRRGASGQPTSRMLAKEEESKEQGERAGEGRTSALREAGSWHGRET